MTQCCRRLCRMVLIVVGLILAWGVRASASEWPQLLSQQAFRKSVISKPRDLWVQEIRQPRTSTRWPTGFSDDHEPVSLASSSETMADDWVTPTEFAVPSDRSAPVPQGFEGYADDESEEMAPPAEVFGATDIAGRSSLESLLSESGVPPAPAAKSDAKKESKGDGKKEGGKGADADPLKDLSDRIKALEKELTKTKDADKKKAKDAAGKPTINWTGQVQTDIVHSTQTAENQAAVGDAPSGVGFRRARLGATGDIFEMMEYRIEMDFALAGRPSFLDNWIGVKDVPGFGNIRIGYFFEPFSLERVTPNRFLTFMERSLVDTFAPRRRTGMMISNTTEDRNVTWAYGVFRTNSDAYGDAVSEDPGWSYTNRATWSPGYDENCPRSLLHLGAAYSFRLTDNNSVNRTRYATRPEIQLRQDLLAAVPNGVGSIPNFVDTGFLNTNSVQLMGLEAAIVRGSFSIQSEYTMAAVDRIDSPNAFLQGAYVYASYFLTGENRVYSRPKQPYRKANGTFDRVVPNTNVFAGEQSNGKPNGPGAWELAARWSYIDLNDTGLNGGRMHDLTAGVNWYLNPYTKVQWNYVHPIVNRAGFGTTTADFYAMRFGFDF